MADEKVVGKIDEVQGGGVIIIRASGEQVIAQPGTEVLEGDTVVSSGSSKAIISVSKAGSEGVVSVSNNESATFDSILFDQAANLIANSSAEDPVNVGEKITPEILRAFNESLPSAGIRTANEDSQSDRAGDSNFSVRRDNNEEIPDAGTPTSFGTSLDDVDEVLPGDGFETDTSERPEEIPDNNFDTDNRDDEDDEDEDDDGRTTPVEVIIAPIDAVDDTVTATEDTQLIINVLNNDEGVNNGITVSLPDSTTTNGGTVTVNPDGTINYTPPANSNSNQDGDDTFVYTITNANGTSDTATVTITVDPVDDPSVLAPDTDTTAEDTVLTVAAGSGDGVLDDDSDVDNTLQVASFTVNGTTTNAGGIATITGVGTVQLNADGGYVFTPALNFNGTVPEITYTTNTGSSSTLNINVTPVDDDVPVAADDTFTTNEDTPITSNVVGNAGGGQDSGVDNGQVTPLTNFDTGNGTVTLDADGNFTYTPDADFNGSDTFTYLVTDDEGDTDTATVTINVSPVNDAPVNTVPSAQTVNEDTALVFSSGNSNQISVADVDTDLATSQLTVNNGNLTVVLAGAATISAGSNGSSTLTISGSQADINATLASITYQGTTDFNGSDTLTILSTDSMGATDTDTVAITVNPVDDGAPVAADDTFSTAQDTQVIRTAGSGISSNDTLTDEADVDPVTNAATTQGGTVTIAADGSFTYTPPNGFNGVDTYVYTIRDVDGDTDTATATFNVGGPAVTIPGDTDPDDTVAEDSTVSDTFSISAPSGIQNITIAGTNVTLAALNGATSGAPVVITTTNGVLNITDYTGSSTSGTVSYTYDPTGTSRDHNNSAETSEAIAITVTDTGANTSSTSTLNIDITDTGPTANDDARSIAEEDSAIAGNAVGISGAASGDVADTVNEAVTVTDVDFGATDGTPGSNLISDHGTFVISSAGVYTYTLDNTDPTVQGLKSGESLVETFTYTIEDTDGSTDTANVTITITGDEDAPPVITIPDTNGGGTVGDASVAENATLTGGTFTVTATAGLAASGTALALTVDGSTTNLTLSQLNGLSGTPVTITDGGDGDLVLTNYNSSTGVITYNFDPTGTNRDHSGGDTSVLENYTIVATDNESDTSTDTLDILITDTQPTAAADNDSITEDTANTTGNVITNDTESADTSASVSAIDFGGSQTVGTPFTTTFGSLDLNSDGSYTYTLDNTNASVQGLDTGESLVETFSYTIVDTDGDTSSTTLAITINGAADAPPVITIPDTNGGGTVGDASVAENATLTGGTFTVTATAGLAASGTALALTVDGNTTNLTLSQLDGLSGTPVTITDGGDGDLVLTNYNSSTGVITYNFDPTGTNRDHSGGDTSVLENYTIVATDNESDTSTDTLDILITDTEPTAAADNDSITEESTNTTGNVITNDTESADTTASVSAIDFGGSQTVGTPFTTTFGSLDLNSDGSYTYTLDNTNVSVQGLDAGESLVETFSYTIVDTDGDTSSTTLAITINGAADAPPVITIPDTNGGGTVGDASVAENATLTGGTFTVTATAGLAASGTALALTVDGDTTNLTLSQLNGLSGTPVTLAAGIDGELVLTNYNSSTGVITYNFDPTGTNRDHSGGDTSVLENYTIVATDNEGDTSTDTLDILITDTAPTAAVDSNSITEDAIPDNVSGDVITNDTTGADTSVTVSAIDFGGSRSVGDTFTTTFGSLDLNSDGTYTYTLDNTNTSVQALDTGESLVETFSYTIADTDGDTSSTTLTITINGANENSPPVNTVPGAQGAEFNNTIVFSSGNSNQISVADADTDLASTQLSVNSGTLSITLSGAATISAGSNGSASLTISGSQADINASLATITYTSNTPTVASTDTLTVTSTDSASPTPQTDIDTVALSIVAPVTAPTIGDNEGNVPNSTGLLYSFFDGQTSPTPTINLDSSTDSGTQLEALADAATPTSNTRVLDGLGENSINLTAIPASSSQSIGMSGDDVVRVTGLIYLEAGHVYEFAGYRDDVLHIELGGQVMVTTTNNSFGNFNSGVNDDAGDFGASLTVSSFTAPANGYYTIEIYSGNVNSSGVFNVSLSDDGVINELNAENYQLFTGTEDLIRTGAQFGEFESNTTASVSARLLENGEIANDNNSNESATTLGTSTGGGYFPVFAGVDVVGVGTGSDDISLAQLSVLPADGSSDTVTSIVIGDIPEGAVLSDSSSPTPNTFTSTGSGGTDSVDVVGWDISTLVINFGSAVSPPSGGSSVTLSVDAVATSSIGNTAASSGTFSVGILSSTFATDSDNSNQVDSIITGTVDDGDDDLLLGSGQADEITASNQAGIVIQGFAGNDTLTGGDNNTGDTEVNGNNTIFGGSGNDSIVGGSGEDIIFAGIGSDTIRGGFATTGTAALTDTDKDTFLWVLGDQGSGVNGSNVETDTIIDFSTNLPTAASAGDVLDFTGLLVGESSSTIGNYITLVDDGTDTTLNIDVAGDSSGTDFIVELQGVTGSTLTNLISNGNIVFDTQANAILTGTPGSIGNDTINGTSADETIILHGGGGSLRGGGGNDTFDFDYVDSTAAAAATDFTGNDNIRVRDYTFGTGSEADVIDLSDILVGATNATVGNFIDINFNNFGSTDIIRVFLDGDAPGNSSVNADFRLEIQNTDLNNIAGSFSNNANTYDSGVEATILAQLISDGNLIVE